MVFGKLYVQGGIDPTYLALEPRSSLSNPIPTGLHGIWMDATNGNALRSDNIYMNVDSNPAYISLKPDNNAAQILLSDGSNTDSRYVSDKINIVYNSGVVENKEDIAVSSTAVVDTISTTDGTSYQNSAITTCSNSGVGEVMTATNLSTTNFGSATINCQSTLVVMGVGCVSPGSPANVDGAITLQATTTNPLLSLSQSQPFAPSYSTILDKNGINQNNSSGAGFTIQSAQAITLTSATNINLNPTGQVLINGNPIVSSITAGNNISVDNTIPTAPVVALQNPLTATLALGAQQMTTGTASGLNTTTNTTGFICQSGGVGGGPITAQYTASNSSVFDIGASTATSISPANITTQNTSNPILTIKTEITPQQVQVRDEQTGVAISTSTMLGDRVNVNFDNGSGTQTSRTNSIAVSNQAQTIVGFTASGTADSTQTINVGANFGTDSMTVSNLATANGASCSTQLNTATSGLPTSVLQLGVNAPTTSPFPDIVANATLQATTSNPALSLSQSAPFANATTMTLDLNNLTHNQGTGSASPDDDFTITTNKTLVLQTTGAFPINMEAPVGQNIQIINGNIISLLDPTSTGFTATYGVGGMDTTYFSAGVASSNADLTNSSGNAQLFLSSTNLATPSAHYVRAEVPLVGDAIIEHQTTSGTARNLQITSDGNTTIQPTGVLSLIGSGITANAGTTSGNSNATQFLASGIGGASFPIMRMENTNATGSVSLEVYKNKPTAGAAGDIMFNQSIYGKDSANVKQEYTRITHTLRDSTAGADEGSMEFLCLVGGNMSQMLQLNGLENEININKQVDLNGNTLRTSSGDILITAAASSGTGNITITPKVGAYIIMNNLPTSAAGLPSGALWNNLGVLNIAP
jgi:hypothetical protein